MTLSRLLKMNILWCLLDTEAFQIGIAIAYEFIISIIFYFIILYILLFLFILYLFIYILIGIQYVPCYAELNDYQKQVLWVNRYFYLFFLFFFISYKCFFFISLFLFFYLYIHLK